MRRYCAITTVVFTITKSMDVLHTCRYSFEEEWAAVQLQRFRGAMPSFTFEMDHDAPWLSRWQQPAAQHRDIATHWERSAADARRDPVRH
jgi:hypothetical protein